MRAHTPLITHPLDRAACDTLGHVAFVDADSAAEGIAGIFRAMARDPVNAALWSTENAALPAATRQKLRAWRDRNAFVKDPHIASSAQSTDITRRSITHQFNTAAKLPCLAALHDHIQARIDIFQALSPRSVVQAQVRGHDEKQPSPLYWPHIDGYGGTPAHQIRVLEPIESDGTLVFANDDFHLVRREKARPIKGHGNITTWHHGVEMKDTLLRHAWQAPANSLLAINNTMARWKPALHAEPLVTAGRTESTRRLLVVYDVCLPRNWRGQFAPTSG